MGVAGSEPFVVKSGAGVEGISVEIWQAVAAQANWQYQVQRFENVPHALKALEGGTLDLVVGPVSITAERAQDVRFSQPYFQSSLSILSRVQRPGVWGRIAPFFSTAFFTAVGILLCVLAVVGTLVWALERRAGNEAFPAEPARGIANGLWFAIVTMSTVGYGDLAPKTFMGRLISGLWILTSIVVATSLVAGIASTLTLTGLATNAIATAEQLEGRTAAVMEDSPGEVFARRFGAEIAAVRSLDEGYNLLKQGAVAAVVFDRPQLLYYTKERHASDVSVSNAEYVRQNYGFALPLSSNIVHEVNLSLLRLQESGRVRRIITSWLGLTEPGE